VRVRVPPVASVTVASAPVGAATTPLHSDAGGGTLPTTRPFRRRNTSHVCGPAAALPRISRWIKLFKTCSWRGRGYAWTWTADSAGARGTASRNSRLRRFFSTCGIARSPYHGAGSMWSSGNLTGGPSCPGHPIPRSCRPSSVRPMASAPRVAPALHSRVNRQRWAAPAASESLQWRGMSGI